MNNYQYSSLLNIITFIIVLFSLMIIPKYNGLLYTKAINQHLNRILNTGINKKLFGNGVSIDEINAVKVLQKTNSESYLSNSRFWSKTIVLDVASYVNINNNIVLLDYVNKYLNNEVTNNNIEFKDFPKPNIGMVIIPKLNLLIPIHEGKFQSQHTIMLDLNLPSNSSIEDTTKQQQQQQQLSLTICGFSKRAQQVNIAPSEEERPIDYLRLAALDTALLEVSDITGEELLSAKFAGTSPARIYRSFVAPRPKAIHTLEPISRAAKRTATQIELSLRQVRADQAAYLRNTDKSAYYNNLLKLNNNNDNNNSGSDSNNGDSLVLQPQPQQPLQRVHQYPIVLVLDNIRSAFNVGSIFRSAETAAVAEVVTCGITAHPPHPKLQKTALSAVDVVPSRHFEDTINAINQLRLEGYQIIAMETTSLSKIYTQLSYPNMKKIALIAGNEITGVDPRIIELADLVIEIPMYGIKNSLNVASAVPIVLFEILRQWNIQ